MALTTFRRSVAPVSKMGAAAGAFGLAGASLFAASPALAAEFECDAVDGLPTPLLVADGVCEIVITSAEAPDEDPMTFTFPASMGKIQAVLVGGGGGATVTDEEGEGYDYGAYGGGGGQVAFVDEVALDTPIDVIIGLGGDGEYNDDAFDGDWTGFDVSGVDPVWANGGYGATIYGGGDLDVWDNEADGFMGDEFYGDSIYLNYDDDLYYHLGGGAGAAGDASWATPGPGFVLSELVAEFGADADLFPASADSVEYGMGGTGDFDITLVDTPIITSDYAGLEAAAEMPPAASGQGGNATLYIEDNGLFSYWDDIDFTDGADGAIILRYGAAELAATGADATPALAAGAVAAALGAGLVGVATVRRRRVTA